MKHEWYVWLTATRIKEFDTKEACLKYAKKHKKEAYEDIVTRGGLIVDRERIYTPED